MTVRTTGASGTIEIESNFSHKSYGGSITVQTAYFNTDSTVTIATNASQDLQVSIQFNTANASIKGRITGFTVEKLTR
jgi:hypothetical protein